jgi:hypothetical protein
LRVLPLRFKWLPREDDFLRPVHPSLLGE